MKAEAVNVVVVVGFATVVAIVAVSAVVVLILHACRLEGLSTDVVAVITGQPMDGQGNIDVDDAHQDHKVDDAAWPLLRLPF